jgi:hypothetical protein
MNPCRNLADHSTNSERVEVGCHRFVQELSRLALDSQTLSQCVSLIQIATLMKKGRENERGTLRCPGGMSERQKPIDLYLKEELSGRGAEQRE